MLTIDQIRAAHGPEHWTLDVPEWGGQVLAKRLTAQDYIALSKEREELAERDDRNFIYMRKLLGLCLVNEDGSPLFANGDGKILDDSPLLVTRLGRELMQRNGILRDEEKNGRGGQSNDSPSGSA